jgi:hypothetical protein
MRDENKRFCVVRMIRFIGIRLQSLLITINTSLSQYLHNLQFTAAHALGFLVFTSGLLATDLSTGTIKVSPNYTLPITMYYSICNVTQCLLILLLTTVLFPWNFRTRMKSIYYSLLQLTTGLRVKVNVMLRPTVSRSVCLGIKHTCGAYDQIFFTVRPLRVC